MHHVIVCDLFPDWKRSELLEFGIYDFPGCYAAFSISGECLYVGRSKYILTRVMSHFIDQKDGNGRRWRLSGTSEWYFERPFAPEKCVLVVWKNHDFVSFEKFLVRELNPSANSHFRKSITSEI